MKKRVLPLLMASSMIVSNPSPLFAQVTNTTLDFESANEFIEESQSLEKESSAEALVGGKEYSSLKEALEVGGEVKLLKSVSVNEVITINNDTTLDLGDFIITNNVQLGRPFKVYSENFTIKANKGGMVIPESNKDSYGFVESYAINFSILGGNYSGITNNGCLFRMNPSEKNTIKTGKLIVDGIEVHTNNWIIGYRQYVTFDQFGGSITNSEFYTDTMALGYNVKNNFDAEKITEANTITISNTKK